MDGMLFVAFFFPLILCGSVILSAAGFFLSLWFSFGGHAADWLKQVDGEPSNMRSALMTVLRHPPMKSYGWFVYPLVMNLITVSTVVGTYSLGKVLYHKKGWKFNQPMAGGIRFVLLQALLWTVFAISLSLPWLSVKGIGILERLDVLKHSEADKASFGGLLVASSALGMLSESLVIVALMVFDSNSSSEFSRKDLALLDTGRWNFQKLFGSSSQKLWWVFIGLQSSMALYACTIAFLAESNAISNGPIRGLLMMVSVSILAVATAFTNAVGGKWRYGEDKYHIYMPMRGGKVFAAIQAIGWLLFAFVWIIVLHTLVSVAYEAKTLANKGVLATAGVMGFIAQLLIALSLLFFDPKKAGSSKLAEQLSSEQLSSEQEAQQENTTRSARKRRANSQLRKRTRSKTPVRRTKPELDWTLDRIMGVRPALAGKKEFLVQWRSPTQFSSWIMEGPLLDRVNHEAVQAAIDAYEKMSSEIGLDSEDETGKEEDDIHEEVVVTTTRRQRFKRSGPRRKRSKGKPDKSNEDPQDQEMEWEECEDEVGNTYYYCVTTGQTTTSL